MKRKDIIIVVAALQIILLPAISKAQQVELPNYLKVLGLKDNVKDIGVYTENDYMYDYCTYAFDNQGRFISYNETETIESAYGWTVFFDSEGLPTHIESVFIDFWTEPDDEGYPPVTTTRYKIRREQDGNVVKLFIEDSDGPEKQVNVTRDTQGRIIEVDNFSLGEVHRYRYLDNSNVPYYYNGMLAFPQVDMVGGHRIDFPEPQQIPADATNFDHIIWQFEVHYNDN